MTTCVLCGRHDDRERSYHGGELCAECEDAGYYLTTNGHVDRDEAEEPSGPAIRCGWCDTLMAAGTQPESTGICERCYKREMAMLALKGDGSCPF